MNGPISEEQLVNGLKSGSSGAWARLYEKFREPLILFVHGQLPPAIRSKVDEEDILQEVFRSVFVRVRQGTFDCDCDERLWDIFAFVRRSGFGARFGDTSGVSGTFDTRTGRSAGA